LVNALPAWARRRLLDAGFVVVPGPAPDDRVAELAASYDAAVRAADPSDVQVGSTTTRVSDFVNRGPAFDDLYLHPPALDAAALVIGGPFKLSTVHARTVRTGVDAQNLHVDFARDHAGWPMLGFILMVDDFRADNGATRFVAGSHHWMESPVVAGETAPACELACGPAGSMILFNGSIWHGHGAHGAAEPRRSIQGAYIRRDAVSGANLPARMTAETLARISPLAKHLLAL
jgi:ectoine hydroxylase-related dioxygenase (phytanoyl-CoA dioxygenase family)